MTQASQSLNMRSLRGPLWAIFALVAIVLVFFNSGAKRDLAFSLDQKNVAQEHWDKAMGLQAKSDWAQAIMGLRQYSEAGGKDPLVHKHLCELYLKTGQFSQALDSAQEYTKSAPDSPESFFLLGVVFNLLGQKEQAIESYQKSLQIDPKFARAHFNLGFMWESDGELLKAMEQYEKAVEFDPKNAKVHYNLGNVYAGLEKDEAAIDVYKKAVEIDPNYMDAFVNISILLTKNGNYKDAVKYLDEARVLGYEAPEEFLQELEAYRE